MIIDRIKDRTGNYTGKIGIYYIDLNTDMRCFVGNQDVFPASGMVMLMTLIEAFRQIYDGKLSKNSIYKLKKSQVSTGEITYGAVDSLHDGISLTVEDLYRLSISVSDNSAFNILLTKLGITSVNATFAQMGYKNMRINRHLFDEKKIRQGIDNYISVEEVGTIFQRLYKGQIISADSSSDMLECLTHHQRTNVIPYNFSEDMKIAHISGYDEGLILDAGIVCCENPFVISMAAHDGDTRKAEGLMRDVTLICYQNSMNI